MTSSDFRRIDKKRLRADLESAFRASHPKSEAFFKSAGRFLIRGGSHNLRLFDPFPFYDVQASGSRVSDLDGRTYVDFWQGHFASVLGHNPKIVCDALAGLFGKGQGLTTGFSGKIQSELAEIILERIPADKIRFTTSGTLASMYSIMLARAFTGKDLVLKAGGGWHGAQPYTLKGVNSYGPGLDRMESAGLSRESDSLTLVTRFNDTSDLETKFREHGSRIACFILEPFIGAGGFIFARTDYLRSARELTRKHGALLIFDEVVSGFRFHAGGVQTLYGVQPDLTLLGKAVGGGMPVAAVTGRGEVLALCSPDLKRENRVKFEGGTFSALPAAMLAGTVSLKHLVENAEEIYPRIGALGEKVRSGMEKIFRAHGFNVKCTGHGGSVAPQSSCVGVQFLNTEVEEVVSPEEVWNPDISDVELREHLFKLAMLEEGFHIFHGFGAVSAAHTAEEIQASLDAAERVARKWKDYL